MCRLQHQKLYVEEYAGYRGSSGGRDSKQHLAAYHNAHNDYLLQLKSSNCLQDEYHSSALPYILEVSGGKAWQWFVCVKLVVGRLGGGLSV